MGPDGLKNNGLRVNNVWEIETAESALLFHELTNMKCSRKKSSDSALSWFVVVFLSTTHSSVMSHMVEIH